MGHIRSSVLSTTKAVLARHGIRPKKSLGQNFLVDERALGKLVGAAHITAQDTVVEIGPGTGALTRRLAELAKRVVAVEKDKNMVELLRRELAERKNVEVVHADALKINPGASISKQYKVVANLPYYIAAPAIRTFLEAENKPRSLTLIVQKEVARRICAKPPKMNLLAVSVQVYAAPKIISSVKKEAFWPKPKVDAAILHIVPHRKIPTGSTEAFFRVVKVGFSHPRKQLINNLSAGLHLRREEAAALLERTNIVPTRRAETLLMEEWGKLARLAS